MKKFNILGSLIYATQGAIVGTGAILPGVSGGVLCVAFGIYEPIMEILSSPVSAIKKHKAMFIPFIIGWLIGFTLLAKAVEMLFTASASVALMLFFGLICGTLPELMKSSEISSRKMSWTPFIVSLAVFYLIFNVLEQGTVSSTDVSIFGYIICGMVWGLSLIIPGLSSSSILLYMGLYEPMTAGIAALDFTVILPLLIGLLITALSLARFVNILLKKHYAIISRVILGIVIASSLKIVPAEFGSLTTIVLSALCFIGGFAVARIMDIVKSKREQNKSERSRYTK